jgi:hypothetical protein
MSPLVTALVSFAAFLALGLIAKLAIGIWIKRNSADPPDRSA